jgi:hypothetical protein
MQILIILIIIFPNEYLYSIPEENDMSQDINNNIMKIIEMLSNAGITETDTGKSSYNSETTYNKKSVTNESNTTTDKVNTESYSITLLESIRPFLNKERQSRLNNCIRILQLSSAAKIFKEQEENVKTS